MFFAFIMIKIKKLFNRIVIFIAILFFADFLYPCFSSADALRIQIGQINTVKRMQETMSSVEIIGEHEYGKYGDILDEIAKQEEWIEKIKNESNGVKGLFFEIAAEVIFSYEEPEKSNILKLFVAKDVNGNVIGARILFKPQYQLDVGGVDAVREEYKRNGIGTKLRKAAFLWMIREGYEAYKVFIHNGNSASFNNLQKICKELNLTLEDITDSAHPKSKNVGRTYLIMLRGRRDLLNTEHDILSNQYIVRKNL